MINHDGYYISIDKITDDSRSGQQLIAVSAYIFKEDGQYRVHSKQEFLNYITDFEKEEILQQLNYNGTYKDSNYGSIVLKPYQPYGNEIELKINDLNTLFNTMTQKSMSFISWEEHDRHSKDRVNKKSIIESLLS